MVFIEVSQALGTKHCSHMRYVSKAHEFYTKGVLIACANIEGLDEPADPYSLARTMATNIYTVWL